MERMKSGQSTLLVVNRVRPISNAEILQGAKEVAKVVGEKVVVLLDPNEDVDDVLRKNRYSLRKCCCSVMPYSCVSICILAGDVLKLAFVEVLVRNGHRFMF